MITCLCLTLITVIVCIPLIVVFGASMVLSLLLPVVVVGGYLLYRVIRGQFKSMIPCKGDTFKSFSGLLKCLPGGGEGEGEGISGLLKFLPCFAPMEMFKKLPCFAPMEMFTNLPCSPKPGVQ